MRKCPICENYITLEQEKTAVPFKGRLAHPACLENAVNANKNEKALDRKEKSKENKRNKKQEVLHTPEEIKVKEAITEEECKERDKLFTYITEQTGTNVTVKEKAIASNYRDKYGFSYKDIFKTVYYLCEVEKGDNLDKSNILGLVPYYFDKAVQYYKEIEDCEINNKDKDIRNMYRIKSIHIKKTEKNMPLSEWKF